MIVSDVGLIAIGTASSLVPDLVTQATSGANPSTWSFSFSSLSAETNIGFSMQLTNGVQTGAHTGNINFQDVGSSRTISAYGGFTQFYFAAMVFPFTCYSSVQRQMTLKLNRYGAAGGVFIGPPVVLNSVCSWFIVQ